MAYYPAPKTPLKLPKPPAQDIQQMKPSPIKNIVLKKRTAPSKMNSGY